MKQTAAVFCFAIFLLSFRVSLGEERQSGETDPRDIGADSALEDYKQRAAERGARLRQAAVASKRDDTAARPGSGLRELSVSAAPAKLMDIRTVPVERRFVTGTVRMVGKVDYDETRVSDITAWVPGRLDRLFVDYTGIPVKKGDHMVSLYSPELGSRGAADHWKPKPA